MKLCSTLLHVLLLLNIFYVSSYNHTNNFEKYNDSDYTNKSLQYDTSELFNSSCCNTQKIKVTFSASIVKNEYIVQFKSYYIAHVRENYIKAALNSSDIKNWKIIPRKNAASKYPSDFDIVQLEETNQYRGLKALRNHPLIKTVTPQRLIRRTLKLVDTTSDPDILEHKHFKRKLANQVGLSYKDFFLNYDSRKLQEDNLHKQ